MKRALLLGVLVLGLSGHKIAAPDGTIVDYSDLELKLPSRTVDCCSDRHCRPVPHRWNSALMRMEIQVPSGWMPVDQSIVVRQAGPPPDGGYHACWFQNKPPHCIWSPSYGS